MLEKIPKRLDPFWLEPEAQGASEDALDQLVRHPGPVWLGLLLDGALNSTSLGIVAGERGACLVAALMQCLPHECRMQFSFTTGLRHSPRRPFRVICLSSNAAENQRLARQQGLTLFDPKAPLPETCAAGRLGQLCHRRHRQRQHRIPRDRVGPHARGTRSGWPEPSGESACPGIAGFAEFAFARQKPARAGRSRGSRGCAAGSAPRTAEVLAAKESVDPWQRADGAHRNAPNVATAIASGEEAVIKIEEEPARVLGQACPAALEDLQRVEDAVFEAMAGKSEALEQLEALWPKVLSHVGVARVDSTRERYLRYALAVWRQLNAADAVHDPQRGLHAMQVICLLFGS